MPSRLPTPVLQVDAGKMHQIDTRNAESLFGMWTVFHKCAESIENGKRLENMSWRLWNRETFCVPAQPQLATTPTMEFSLRPKKKDVPELSSSVSSIASEESDRRVTPEFPDEDSAMARSRGHEKHITSESLEKLVITIKEKQELEPLSPSIEASLPQLIDDTPRPSSPNPRPADLAHSPEPQSNNSTDSQCSAETACSDASALPTAMTGSDTSVSSAPVNQSPTIVHGFSPSLNATSFKSRSNIAHAATSATKSLAPPEAKKKEAKFYFGSSNEDESSFEDRVLPKPARSSLSEGLNNRSSQAPKKQASFREILESQPMEAEDAIESDEDESAVEDEDDDSSWEDSDNESRSSSVEEKPLFQRVDSRPNLTSRRSLLTTALTQGDRAQNLQRAAMAAQSSPNLRRSRRSSPNGPSMPGSPEAESALTMRGPDVPRSKPIIVTTSNTHPPAHSPRTTRRNMLSTEMTESLRRHLLWERQPRGGTANAVFKRSHTAHNLRDKANNKAAEPTTDTSKNNSWNHYFDYGPWEYHTKGW